MNEGNTPTKQKENEVNEVQEIEVEVEEITFSAKELAALCGTEPKTFRRWLRAQTEQRANKGGRWSFDEATRDHYVTAWFARNEPKADTDDVAADEEFEVELDEI
jgi:hypothetical protein